MDFILRTAKRKLPLHENSFVKATAPFSIYADIRKLQDKAKTSYTLSTRRLRFGYEQQFSRSTSGTCFGVVGEEFTAYLNGITGEYAPPAGYLVNEKEAEAFDREFPYMEKKKLPEQIFEGDIR